MHAVFVLPRSYPYRGGYENSQLSIARLLVNRGHRATVFTTVANDLASLWVPNLKTFPAEDVLVDGVTVRRFPICYKRWRRRATRFAGMLPYWRWKAQYWRPSFRVPGLHEALREIDADIIHIGPLPYNCLMYAGIQAGEHLRVPVLATPCTHFGEPTNSEIAKDYVRPHQIALLNQCHRVICMTDFERQELAALGVPVQRMTVLPYGIDLNHALGGDPRRLRDRYGIDGPVVLHLGMKAFDKGSKTVVEAMDLLWKRGSEAWLVMAGPSLSDFDEYMANRAPDLPRVLNLPAFADDEKRDLLAAADVVVQPSRVESLGLVLCEAWANAKPVIAADIRISRQLVTESGGGEVVPFGDSNHLADAIETLLGDLLLRQKMGQHGREFALARYQGEESWQRIVGVFENVAKGAG
jgi:glycosyltransferase involved in cell wall biosynthesis